VNLYMMDADAAVLAVIDLVCELHPYIARQMGRHDYDGRLPSLAPHSGEDFAVLSAAVDRQLSGLADSADPELRADLDTSRALLQVLRFRTEELGQRYPFALEYVYEVDVSGYLAADYAPLGERVAALLRHLAGIPTFLARGEQLLTPSISAGERMNVIAWGTAQAATIGGIADRLVASQPDLAELVAPLAGAAVAACRSFAGAVAAKAPSAGVVGPERLAEMLSVGEGHHRPVAELIAQTEAEIATVQAAIGRAIGRIGETRPEAAYERMRGQLPEGSVADALRSITERLREFWTRNGVLPVHTRLPIEIHESQASAHNDEVVFAISPPLEAVRRAHRVYVPEPHRPAVGQPPADAWSYLNEPTLEMLAVHEIYGHYLQMETASAGPSVIRNSVLWFAGCTEGWAHYAEELAIEQGLATDHPLVEIAQLRFALEAATRLLVYLSVHSGRWTFTEACARASALTGWSAKRTIRDVMETVANRARAMYTLGKMQIREWRSATVGQADWTLRDFHGRIMGCGSAPLSTVQRYLADSRRAADAIDAAADGARTDRSESAGTGLDNY
jgi:hypothetical protein